MAGARESASVMRVEAALDGMTFAQRVGQLNQRLLGWRAVERSPRGGFRLTDEAHREIDRWGGLGALYGLFRADAWSGRHWGNGIHPDERAEVVALVQEEVCHASGGIGVLLSEEAPHGHQALGGTTMPVPLAAAATFDPDLVREAYAAVAQQLAASGVHLALVSALDLLRDPRWGRAEECFGEDPHLAAEMTAAVVTGMQGVDRARVGADGVAVVLKHLAAQGEAMGGRNGQSSVIGARDLDELHLPMVERGVVAGALGFMAAYNDIDGVPCCANPVLLREILRERYGFDGIVMADGIAVDRLEPLFGPEGTGRAALLAGVDLSLWDEGFTRLDQAADDPEVRPAVDVACRRVLELKDRFGLLQPARAVRWPDLRESIELGDRWSRTVADSSLVLLDDGDGLLPLVPGEVSKVIVTGPFADDVTAMLGDYVPPLRDEHLSVARALAVAMPETDVELVSEEGEAVAAAADADAVVVVLGGTSHRSYEDEFASNGALHSPSAATSGEGVDLASLDLPGDQLSLLRKLDEAARGRLVVVVIAGRPHVLTPVVEAAAALLWAGFPGPWGGAAIADALVGRRSPTGRLPFTAPRSSGVVPVHHNDRHDPSAPYRDVSDPVLFPFGAGRGYRDPILDDHRLERSASGVSCSFRAANPHERAVDVVVPVYVRRTGGPVLPRQRELVAVVRGAVDAGGSAEFRADIADECVRVAGFDGATDLVVTVGDWSGEIELVAR